MVMIHTNSVDGINIRIMLWMEDVVGVEDKDWYCLLDYGVLDHHSQMHATIFGELHGSLSFVLRGVFGLLQLSR